MKPPTSAEGKLGVLMAKPKRNVASDPFAFGPRLLNRLHTLWLAKTYPFSSIGKNLWFHHSCEIKRAFAKHMDIGNSVFIDRGAWFNIPETPESDETIIILEDGCNIGRDVQISAKNRIHIERDVMVAGHVLIMDHNHAYEDVTVSISDQGITAGGTIRIEQSAWIGFGAAIVCSQGNLVIGKHSVIGSNCVVTRSIPPYSIVVGNPARIIKQFDPSRKTWELGARTLIEQVKGS
jgi:acetyltransferase-like isoleucine patch superfamily enzyme